MRSCDTRAREQLAALVSSVGARSRGNTEGNTSWDNKRAAIRAGRYESERNSEIEGGG